LGNKIRGQKTAYYWFALQGCNLCTLQNTLPVADKSATNLLFCASHFSFDGAACLYDHRDSTLLLKCFLQLFKIANLNMF